LSRIDFEIHHWKYRTKICTDGCHRAGKCVVEVDYATAQIDDSHARGKLSGDEKERSYVLFPGSPRQAAPGCEAAAGEVCGMSMIIA
jgi:hypothetical protein